MAKLMVVDDEVIIANQLEESLTAMGYHVVGKAFSGETAIDMALRLKPDLVLMDIKMPGRMDGIDAARKIKKAINIPSIFLTAYGDDQIVRRAKAAEPYGYILKPYNETELKAALEIGLFKQETENRLLESREMLRKAHDELKLRLNERDAILRSVGDAIISVDKEMHIIWINEATEKICGIDSEKTKGGKFTDIQIPCDKSCLEALTETLRTKTAIKEYHLECNHKDQTLKSVVLNSSLLFDANGKAIGAVLVVRDITRLSDLERQLQERHQFHNIIGKSEKMKEIYTLLQSLADIDTTVLITGESGTGKEVIAKTLHYSSNRAFKPLIKVNCSALAENLLESELFGHVKGAFTGAVKNKLGRFQAADHGTILLDEIGDTSPLIQLKLLRVLQEREFEKVGDSTTIKVDVRVIATANSDLREKMKSGEFRKDLFYRLNVVVISLPPLCERMEDIPLLAEHFFCLFKKRFNKNIVDISNEALKTLMAYPWPGNVRELEHAIEHAFVLCNSGKITVDDLPPEIKQYFRTIPPLGRKQAIAGPQEILQALERSGWNKAKAARFLGIGRRTLYRKINEYNISESGKA